MSELAIDRFRRAVEHGERPFVERKAQEIAAEFGAYYRPDPNLLLGYLEQSVATALERGRWRDRDRLAIDLRVVDILRARPHRPTV